MNRPKQEMILLKNGDQVFNDDQWTRESVNIIKK